MRILGIRLPIRLPFRLPSLHEVLSFNLFVSRQFAYSYIMFVAIAVVLLPTSLITYLSFYKMLVPVARLHTPIKFVKGEVPPAGGGRWSTAVIDNSSVLPFLMQNANFTFLVRLNMKAYCQQENAFQNLDYSLKLAGSTVQEDSFLVNCDSRYIYVEKNWWIPYNLRYWAPPILVNIFKEVLLDLPMLYLPGYRLHALLQRGDLLISLKNHYMLYLESNKTHVDFVIEWEGFRYSLVKYYYLSMFIGTGFFWILSATFCLISSLYVQTRLNSEPAEERKVKSE